MRDVGVEVLGVGEILDDLSGLETEGDAGFDLTTNVENGTEDGNASTDSRAVRDVAGNESVAGPIEGIKVDRKGPAITITTPAEGESYERRSEVAADYSCEDSGSGPGSCSGPVENGQNIDTSSLGEKTFTVEATDAVGNTSSLTRSYTVGDSGTPETEISDGPEGPTSDDKPTFTFSGSDGATPPEELVFSYRLNDGGWSEYSSGTSVTLGGEEGLDDGEYTFEVRAKDAASNVDESPARRSFTVDAGLRSDRRSPPPQTAITRTRPP